MKATWGRTLLRFFHVWRFEEVNVAIISSHRFLLLHLWGMGIRGTALQSAGALLFTASSHMQKDKKQRAGQCAHVFLSFFQISHFLFCHSLWETEIDNIGTFLSPAPPLAVRDCFIRGIFMGGERRPSYWCSSLAFCEAQWALLIDCARRPMMWHRGTPDM